MFPTVYQRQRSITIGTVWMVILVCVSTVDARQENGVVEERVQETLERHRFEWYDPQTDRAAPVSPQVNSYEGSAARNSIASYNPIVAPKVTPPKWNSNWLSYFGWLSNASWIIYGGLGVLLVLLIVLAVWFLRKIVNTDETGDNLVDARLKDYKKQIKELPFEIDTELGNCRDLAEAAFRNGDHSRAIIYLFSHALLHLDQHQVVRLRRGKTNRQYLSETRELKPAYQYFSKLINPFESVFFGNHQMNPDEFSEYWRELPEFENQVRNRPQVSS